MSKRCVITVVSAAVAVLGSSALAEPALAAQRWVAPIATGEGDCSSEANAGTIQNGFEFCGGFVQPGDEIIVTPGTYTIKQAKEALAAPVPVSVHGLAGKPRPKIVEPSSAGEERTTISGPAQVSYLEIKNETTNGTALETGPLDENVIAVATGKGGSAISSTEAGLVRDSLAETTGEGGIAINGGPSSSLRAQNVTAFSTGSGSYGIQATTLRFEFTPGSGCLSLVGQVTAENVIAHGAADDVATILNGTCAAESAASISLDFSNFHTTSPVPAGTIHDNGNNQESPALTDPKAIFVAPGVSPPDLHELASAPTIDGGIENMLGPTDPEGNPRVLGAAPDIGAFEFVPTGMPTKLTTSLSGGGKAGESIIVPEGTAVSDTASLTGTNASTATGAVSYKVYADTQCTKLVAEAGPPVTVTGGSAPASKPETLAPGTSYWQASYSGDTANAPSRSVCGAEIETVEEANVVPTPTPTPTPTPPPTPTLPPAPPALPTAKVITFTLSGAPGELADGSLDLELLATGPGSFSATGTTTGPVAKAGVVATTKHKGQRKRTLVYGSGRAKATAPGIVHLRINPTATGAKALRQYKRLKLTITISFQPTVGPVVLKITGATVNAPRHRTPKTRH